MKDPFWDDTYLVEEGEKLVRKKHTLVCDFCLQPLGASCWTYPCGHVELPLVDDPTGLPACSDDPWACCHACRPLVEAKDWHTLAERSAKSQLAAVGETPPDASDPRYRLALLAIVNHFRCFDSARNGEPFEEHAPYKEH